MPLRKIDVQLQFSQTGAVSAEVDCNRKILGLFVRLMIQPTCLCPRKHLGASQI